MYPFIDATVLVFLQGGGVPAIVCYTISMEKQTIVIVGGGFGGVQTALALAKKNCSHARIILISDKHHFEYTPALYRVVAGKSPLEVCIPLEEIFKNTDVEICVDPISKILLPEKKLESTAGSHYHYDYLVLALGAEPAFFNIPGLDQFSLGFKSINQALVLKNHLHALFEEYAHEPTPTGEAKRGLHIDVVGAGPSGVELAGELHYYLKGLTREHGLSRKDIMIDLIEAGPRLLPMMPPQVSKLAAVRLADCGVHIMTDTAVMAHDGKTINFKDGSVPSKTLIWTAGVKPHHIYKETVGLTLAKNGRVEVDEYLRAKGNENVFVLGDSAATAHAGTAQTAIYDGKYIAKRITELTKQTPLTQIYYPQLRPYVIPIGRGWALFIYKNFVFSGLPIWWLREIIDLRFFLSILPLRLAWRAWREGQHVCESCPTCTDAVAQPA